MATRDASAAGLAEAPHPWWRLTGSSRLSRRLEALFEGERDQLPLWLPVGLMLGIGAWFWLPDADRWLAFLAAATAASLGFAAAATTRWGRAMSLFCLAATLGCALVWWRAERVAAPRLERAQMMELNARIESTQTLAAERMLRLVVAPEDLRLAARMRVNVPEDRLVGGLRPGAVVRLRAWLMPPAPMAAPGGYDFARAAWFQRIGGTGRVLDIAVTRPPSETSWRARIADWRQRLSAHVRERLGGGAEGGIAAALATGDQYGIPDEDAEAMRRSGLAHLLSVSGLHLTAVVGAVMLLTLKLLALSPTLALRFRLILVAAAAGAAAGIAYTLLTGAEVPTVRSCIAALLVLAGIALGREALTLRLVAVGALIVLVLWPESLPGPSFQMSFAAITAIVALHENRRVQALLSRRDERTSAKLLRFLGGLILTGLAVEVALMPIALFHFHKAGLYGAIANVVAIPLTTFVVMPLEALALLFDLVGLGAPFWWLTGQSLSFLLWLAHSAAAAPGAVALLPAMPPGAYALMAAGGLWICLWRTRWRRFGLVPIAAGAAWALGMPAPDLIVTGDGRHLVLRTADGQLALLRPRAGDYVRDTLAELSGAEAEYLELERLPIAACSTDLCTANIDRGGRRWRLLATRSMHLVRWEEMVRACAEADIVIADRLLPRGCNPRWLKADRQTLARTGGLAITFTDPPRVESVADQGGAHPWAPSRVRAAAPWESRPTPSRNPAAAPPSPARTASAGMASSSRP
ncbi:MAG TPA: ComEC/Rec2 family competence protein [Allosphingosinicella sp.]|jgi:competence protein ComEC|nr:ComEC/Rec2 family competence protein [Allosphingosinicella sp.]